MNKSIQKGLVEQFHAAAAGSVWRVMPYYPERDRGGPIPIPLYNPEAEKGKETFEFLTEDAGKKNIKSRNTGFKPGV